MYKKSKKAGGEWSGCQRVILRDRRQYREMIRSFDAGDERQEGMGERGPMPYKSPSHAAKRIKKVAHHFRATMVGITNIEPDW
jgi:hypothetical protein